ncbi:MAG: glycosyltransferase family 4 protein [Solirubrobacteraceae bacterium]
MRPRLAVALTFPVSPALGGGQVRVLNLYRELARTFDVELVSLAPSGRSARRTQLAPGLWESQVPKSEEHAEAESDLARRAQVVVTDVAMPRLHRLTPDYMDALRAATQRATAVIASHPYTYPVIREVSDAPLCYEAHNVEATLKADLLRGNETALALLAEVRENERTCCQEAHVVWTCSGEDRAELIKLYGVNHDDVLVVPNGVALDDFVYSAPATRLELKRRLRMQDRFTALFLASWHQPNVLAARRLVDVARDQPAVDFLVVGSVGAALEEQLLPNNVSLTGAISAELKRAVLGVADVALNPVTTGSGTNIKMLDYFASGTPVIASGFGARGLGVQPEQHYVRAEPDEIGAALTRVRAWEPSQLGALVRAARSHVEETLSWAAIADDLAIALLERFGVELARPSHAHAPRGDRG